MKKFFVFLLIASVAFLGLTQISSAADKGSGTIKILVVAEGLNVLVDPMNPSYAVKTNLQNIFAFHASGGTNYYKGVKIQNIGDVPFTISLQITNDGGANIITSGDPGTVLPAKNDIRIAGLFVEWSSVIPGGTDFADEDVIPTTAPKAATRANPYPGLGIDEDVFGYTGSGWGSGVGVEPTGERPLALSIDMGPADLGESFPVILYVEVN